MDSSWTEYFSDRWIDDVIIIVSLSIIDTTCCFFLQYISIHISWDDGVLLVLVHAYRASMSGVSYCAFVALTAVSSIEVRLCKNNDDAGL